MAHEDEQLRQEAVDPLAEHPLGDRILDEGSAPRLEFAFEAPFRAFSLGGTRPRVGAYLVPCSVGEVFEAVHLVLNGGVVGMVPAKFVGIA